MKLTLITVLVLLSCNVCNAAMMFGEDDNIYVIQDVDLTSPNNKPMQLAHRVTNHFFIGGIYTTDNGYVLIEKGSKDEYWTLTENEMLQYQADKFLPTPMPSYKIPFWDYLFGYSLWLIIAGVVVYYFIKEKFFPDKEEVATDTSPAA